MLRFDVPPVWSNVTRWEAFTTFVIAVAALLVSPWLMAILAVQGLVRGFLGHYKCPSHRLWVHLAERNDLGGRKENAGAKMFANKILLLASLVAVVTYALGLDIWQVPVYALILFSTLEWAVSFCAACWAYGFWYSLFPPKGI
ncbi:DUF4395 family protein [Castellaniella sp.]|uniref:DUF4395 family protein n=1 Tax=Castellaniella sp. TaxID=1955812 RepID=UPI00356AD997